MRGRSPSGRGLGGGGLSAGGGGLSAGGGGGGLKRGSSEKGGGFESQRKSGFADSGMKRQASEKLNLSSTLSSGGKFQPSSLVSERKPSAKFQLERQASVNMGTSASGKSNASASSRPPR